MSKTPITKQKAKPEINLVWFKRDLRLSDHEPIKKAFATGSPTLMVYNFEPILLKDPHYTERHWRFVWQSLIDLNDQLKPYGGKIYHFSEPMVELLERLSVQFQITLYSHEEIGLKNTFERDKEVTAWCDEMGVRWLESPTAAILRGLKNRNNWDAQWKKTMSKPCAIPEWKQYYPFKLERYMEGYRTPELPQDFYQEKTLFQQGGPKKARETLKSFLAERGLKYQGSLSSPSKSRIHCSRLSAYLAWGNISLRQVYKYTQKYAEDVSTFTSIWHRPLNAFKSRLHWHCHFIQKFESQFDMEFLPLNPGYNNFPYRTDFKVAEDIALWASGKTGIPIIDASMRCLKHTGYINFRMRAMLVSFVTHHLNIDWRLASLPLSQYFLDFEPGIHYPQIQMQASVTGINIVRVYNPIKQSKDRDENGIFIKQWCPELDILDEKFIHEPWLYEADNADPEKFRLGKDYPEPMIDLKVAAKEARDRLWSFRKRADVQEAIPGILRRHITPNSSNRRRSSKIRR